MMPFPNMRSVWDFAHTRPDQYPLLLNVPYVDLSRKQVIKQADLVLAMHLCGDAFTSEQKARNFAHYEPLTVRDSSLSASTQAILVPLIGIDLAWSCPIGRQILDHARDCYELKASLFEGGNDR